MPENESQFQVNLGNLKLPADVQKRIAVGIREVVLKELAALDLKGTVAVRPGLKFDKRWWGIWIDYPIGPKGPGGPGPGPIG